MNPFSDVLAFLFRTWWPVLVLWALLLASLAVALHNYRRAPELRTGTHLWLWAARVLMGCLWWQQTLWKLPPTYGFLREWVEKMAQYAAFPAHSALVREIVQPNFPLFGLQVYLVEGAIAVSLLLGVFTRLGGALGALMALNLWLGLYRHPQEWPWTYMFLFLLQVTFVVLRAGRSLGVDALLARRLERPGAPPSSLASRLLTLLT